MSKRLHCCVPFCGRSTKNEKGYVEWVCQKHFGPVSARAKFIHRAAKRAQMRGRAGWTKDEINALAMRAWARVKREAIERAAGIYGGPNDGRAREPRQGRR
jgi:hypothetical protein